MVHIRRIREKLKEDTKNPKYIKRYGEWDIKLNDYREITKLKNNIATKSILKILGYTFVVILIFSLIVDGFYNDTIANEVSSFNRSLYLFLYEIKLL